MDVSIIIVNYNTRQLTCECIDSIFEKTRDICFEVILVDNASVDGSEEFFKKDKRIKYIYNTENIGFGRANNIGMNAAQGKYLFLLNSDTLLCNNALKFLFDFAENTSIKIGCIGGILLDRDGNATNSFGDFPSIKNETRYLINRIKAKLFNFDKGTVDVYRNVREKGYSFVDFVVGADMFIPRQVIEHVGGFCPDFFMYYEETDWQMRMATSDFQRLLISGPHIIHLEGRSFDKSGLTHQKFAKAQRSMNLYISKYYSGVAYCLFRVFLCCVRLPTIFRKGFTLKEGLNAYKIVICNEI